MDSSSSIQLLPPGFRFHPSDQELIIHYLRNRVTSTPLPAPVIADVDLYQFDPWQLPKKALFGEDEWYFFTPRDRKYPNGARPNRAAASGYWKATGIDKPIFSSCGTRNVGVKKALVFYSGRPPRGVKTEWIMHEYRLLDAATISRQKGSMRLDNWVLCRVRKKTSIIRNRWEDRSPSHPPEGSHLQKAEGLWSLDKEPNHEPSKNNINNCPLLPYLLDSARFPLAEPDSSISSAKTIQASTTMMALTRNLSDKEEIEFSRTSLDNLLELFKECSDEPHNRTVAEAGSRISASVSVDNSDAVRFHSPEKPNYTEKDDEFMNAMISHEESQCQSFRNFRVDEWNPIFQI